MNQRSIYPSIVSNQISCTPCILDKSPHKTIHSFVLVAQTAKEQSNSETSCFWKLLNAAQRAHAVNCMLLQARPSSIHPFLFIPSLSEWSTGALLLIQCFKKKKNNPYESSELVPLFYFNVRLFFYPHFLFILMAFPVYCSVVPFVHVVWLIILSPRETTMMCSDICDTIWEERCRATCSSSLIVGPLTVALFVIKWMMTTHFIIAQWVTYNKTVGAQGGVSECHNDRGFWYVCYCS